MSFKISLFNYLKFLSLSFPESNDAGLLENVFDSLPPSNIEILKLIFEHLNRYVYRLCCYSDMCYLNFPITQFICVCIQTGEWQPYARGKVEFRPIVRCFVAGYRLIRGLRICSNFIIRKYRRGREHACIDDQFVS